MASASDCQVDKRGPLPYTGAAMRWSLVLRAGIGLVAGVVTALAVERVLATVVARVDSAQIDLAQDWPIALYLMFEPGRSYGLWLSAAAGLLAAAVGYLMLASVGKQRWPLTVGALMLLGLLVAAGLLGGAGLGWVVATPGWREEIAYARWWLTDEQPPVITLTVPAEVVRGVVAVNVETADEGPHLLSEFALDDVPLPVAESLLIDTRGLADGEHLLLAEVEDQSRRQNRAQAWAKIRTDNTPPTLTVRLDPPVAAQGHSLLVSVRASEPVRFLTATLAGRVLMLAREGDEQWAVIGYDPDTRPTTALLTVEASDWLGNTGGITRTVVITAFAFPVEYLRGEVIELPADRRPLLDYAASENAFLDTVFAPISPSRLWLGPFTVPLSGTQSSPFAIRRSYDGGPLGSYHGGVDLAVDSGVPVAAANRGLVVLAESLKVRGNAVIIDHGMGVYSCYYHLSEIQVKKGQSVDKGQVIGLSGNSGLSTGPHLHWELRVTGEAVDPWEWTKRVVP